MDLQKTADNYAGQATTMKADYPNFQARTLQGNINQAGLPQAAQQQNVDYQTFAKMFQSDPYGQQYMNQNFNNAGSIGSPTGTPVQSTASNVVDKSLQGIVPNMPSLRDPSLVSTIPQLTQQNIGQGFQGFTNPTYAAEARTQDLSNVSGTMKAIQDLIGNNWTAAQNASNQTDTNQLAKIEALMSLANYYQSGATAKASASGGGGGGGTGATTGSTNQAGGTYDDIVTNVQKAKSGKATNTDVWNYINQHSGALKDQGVDVGELWKLQKEASDKSGGPHAAIAGGVTGDKSAASAMSSGEKSTIKNLLEKYLAKWKGMSKLDRINPGNPDYQYLSNLRTNMTSIMRKAIVGGRASNQDMTVMMGELPPIGVVTPITNKVNIDPAFVDNTGGNAKIQGIYDSFGINATVGGDQGSGGGSSVDRQGIVSKLKSSGYNDSAIHEYLKMKGIDK
jgi:hypothetical protein